MTRKHLTHLIFAFAILLVGRLWIAGTGYLENQDEFLYTWIHLHFADFTHSSTWVQCMFDMQGQPPEIAIRLLQYISVYPVSVFMGKQMLHPEVLYFIGLYNILCSLLILHVFYKILLKLKFGIDLAIAGVILLGTLFNFNLYTRHILPYDHALLFQLLALNLLLRQEIKQRTILFAGLLSAIGVTNYYGTFMFVFINGGYIVLHFYKTPLDVIKKCLLFILPFFVLVSSYEVLTHANGGSYLGFLAQYSKTVNMASFDEGFNYIFRYFYQVEKIWGIVVLVLFFAGSYLIFLRGDSLKTKQVLFLGLIAYLFYGGCVFFSHKMVFHGRVLHPFYPFVVVGVLGFLQQQRLMKPPYLVGSLVLFALFNYSFVIKDFNSIGYPRNAIYKYHLFEEKGKINLTYYEEMSSPIHYTHRSEWRIDSIGKGLLSAGHYLASNLCFNPHFPDSSIKPLTPLLIAPGDSIVFEQLHFQSHPAYAFEYCTRYGRNYFIDKQLQIRVIKTDRP